MALISNSLLSDISNAINNKLGTTGTISPVDFATKISQIGGGSSPTGTIEITTNGIHNVEAYQYASVSVPTTDEAGLSWNIVNNLTNANIYIRKDSTYISEYSDLDRTTNKYTIKNFCRLLNLTIFPQWGYRFKNDNKTLIINGGVSFLSSDLRDCDISIHPDLNGYIGHFTSEPLITDLNNSSTITISGNIETEAAPTLTTFDTTGLTKTWTGTFEYRYQNSNAASTTSDFPFSYYGTVTTSNIYNIFGLAEVGTGGIRFNYSNYNKLNPSMTCLEKFSGYYGSYDEFYIQIGDIFIHYPPTGTYPGYILPVNCSIEYLVNYLNTNLSEDGDTITAYKWEASS